MEDRPNAFWKLPGGRNKGTESPRQAIVREIHEETGLKINQNDLIEFEKIEHAAHDQYVFAILVSSFKGLRELGQENGTKSLTIKLFPARKILQEDLLPPHRKVLERSRPGLDKLGAAI
jgi:ADP-ribose pyrophosphatase YjhB (NUDIX family)